MQIYVILSQQRPIHFGSLPWISVLVVSISNNYHRNPTASSVTGGGLHYHRSTSSTADGAHRSSDNPCTTPAWICGPVYTLHKSGHLSLDNFVSEYAVSPIVRMRRYLVR